MTVSATRRVYAWVSLAVSTLAVSALALAFSSTASAQPTATPVRLGITGMVTSSAPNGTWTLHARPGQTLDFLAGFVPGLDGIDAKQVVSVRVSMDAEHLPGGAHATVLQTKNPVPLTVHKPGSYPLHWTVEFLVGPGHGHKTTVEATRTFNAAIHVDAATPVSRPGQVSPGDAQATALRSAAPSATVGNVVTTPHQTPRPGGSESALPATAPPPTISLAPDSGAGRRPNPAAIAPLPLAAAADTYVFTAIVGTFVIGFLWLLWVASIKPILGR